MSARASSFSTKNLTKKTWPDFETLFTQGNGWDFCWCVALQRDRPLTTGCRTRAEQSVVNQRAKRNLLLKGLAHGVLVYADGEPIGWCEYGPKDELPVLDRPRGRFAKPATGGLPDEDWRITCFVVAKKYRRQGVATVALQAAIASIRDHGGGVVEAYPLDPATSDRWGPGTRADYGHFGTVSMFEAEGFARVGWLRQSNAIMRKTVRPDR
ncbi:MAG: GNAT family N-acetyltransferase [Actinomycetota bacterium]|nr:GNAT family N-acetyltransferase [Actinomycetota bacterium]